MKRKNRGYTVVELVVLLSILVSLSIGGYVVYLLIKALRHYIAS